MPSCLIIGTGQDFLAEAEAAQSLTKFDCIMAVKRTIYYYPGKVDCFITLHPEWALGYIGERHRLGYEMGFDTYTCRKVRVNEEDRIKFGIGKVHEAFEGGWAGSSGLYAVRVAVLVLGFDKIVLAGMPMDLTPRYNEKEIWATGETGIHRYRRGWNQNLEYYGHKVRSMSGWTAQLLGRPDRAWLNPGEV